MNPFPKIVALTGVLALTAGSLQPCLAGTEASSIRPIAPGRNYVGQVTRTGPTGKKTFGEVTLNIAPATGFVIANVTMKGKTRTYFGTVSPVARDPRSAPGLGKRSTGVLSQLRLSSLPTTPSNSNNQGTHVAQFNVTFTKNEAAGGAATANGSTLEFTAARLGTTLNNHLPAVILPVSTTPIGTLPVPGNGG